MAEDHDTERIKVSSPFTPPAQIAALGLLDKIRRLGFDKRERNDRDRRANDGRRVTVPPAPRVGEEILGPEEELAGLIPLVGATTFLLARESGPHGPSVGPAGGAGRNASAGVVVTTRPADSRSRPIHER